MKKLAAAAIGTLLVASMVAGTGIVGTQTQTGYAPQTSGGSEVNKTISDATPAAPKEAPAQSADAPAETSGYSAYLFVHFVEEEKSADHEQIYYSVSTDGTEWTTLNDSKPVLKSNVGEKGVRDPHIIRTPDDKFVIIATDLSIFNRGGNWGTAQTGGSRNIIVWKGDSLTDMGTGKAVAIGTEDALDVWAPESIWDVDQEKYMVTWASIVGDRETKTCYDWHYRIYRSYTEDFETFTEPEVYMEREGNIIDTTFYYNEANQMYYRFTKDEHNKWVFMEQGAHLDGDFEMVATYSLDGQHYSKTTGVEGPTVYKSNTDDKWFLLLDNWTYKPYETDDITKGVFTTAGEFTFNGPLFRHGSVIPITQEEYDALLAAYPNPEPAEPDKTEGNLIYDLGFENNAPKALTGNYVATVNGTITYADGKNGGQAAVIKGDNNFLSLDGTMLKGHQNLTVSFDVKIGDTNQNYWVYFAAPNDHSTDGPTYIGGLFKTDDGGLIACERFLNGRSPDSYSYFGPNEWVNVTVVYGNTSTKIYVNGKIADRGRPVTDSTCSLTDILGENPIFYLGKATWGSGEYSNMTLDRFRVYDYAMPDSKVAELYAADTAN